MHTQKVMMVVALLLMSCATKFGSATFSDVFAGKVADGSAVLVEGVMDTSGINFYSLQDRNGGEGMQCVALILKQAERPAAKALDGQPVKVSGKIIAIADLNAIFPNQSGEIDGRFWGGTKCEGSLAIFVQHVAKR